MLDCSTFVGGQLLQCISWERYSRSAKRSWPQSIIGWCSGSHIYWFPSVMPNSLQEMFMDKFKYIPTGYPFLTLFLVMTITDKNSCKQNFQISQTLKIRLLQSKYQMLKLSISTRMHHLFALFQSYGSQYWTFALHSTN